MQVEKDGTYAIHVEDPEGYTNRNPITYYIRAMPDEAPQVKIGAPGKDTAVPLDGTLALGLKVSDDFGLAKVELVCQRAAAQPEKGKEDEAAPEQVVQTWTAFQDPKNASIAFDWNFSKERYRIKDVVTYYVRATDNKPGEPPNLGQSAKFKVEIKDVEADKAAKHKAYFEWRSHVEKALDMQKDARKQADALLRALGVAGHETKKNP
jgi:hypothetical protein